MLPLRIREIAYFGDFFQAAGLHHLRGVLRMNSSTTTLPNSTPNLPPGGTIASAAFARVRADYIEMPGLSLTLPQAARFFGLDQNECRLVLETLVSEHFLRSTVRGYTRQ